MLATRSLLAKFSIAGPSKNPLNLAPSTKRLSPLPQPILRSAQATAPPPSPSPTSTIPPTNTRSKSLFQSYMSSPAEFKIGFGLVFVGVAFAGLYWDRTIPDPVDHGEKPLISVRMVDRDK